MIENGYTDEEIKQIEAISKIALNFILDIGIDDVIVMMKVMQILSCAILWSFAEKEDISKHANEFIYNFLREIKIF